MFKNKFSGIQHIESDFTTIQKKPILRTDNHGYKERWNVPPERLIDELELYAFGQPLVAECGERLDWAYKRVDPENKRRVKICKHCLAVVFKREKTRCCKLNKVI